MVATPHATYLVGCLEDSDEVRLLLASQDREEAAPGPCSVESAVSSSCLCSACCLRDLHSRDGENLGKIKCLNND